MILPNKHNTTYVEALNSIKTILKPIGDTTSKPLNPQVAMTDFEPAMQNALTYCFPNIQLKGCFFHLKQAVQHWIKTHGYKPDMRHNSEFKIWVNMLTTLAFVRLSVFNETV